jgi:D-alanine-D-alanine ligase
MPPDPIRLVVLFGGRSAEHEVSCTTAASVLGAVDRDRYEVVPVGITREGRWVDAVPPACEGPPVDPMDVLDAPATVVLVLLHGPMGEDGTVQGLLEVAGVPYVGSGVLGSALAMDKVMAKQVLGALGLPQPRWRAFRAGEAVDVGDLGWPVFVKPANMGSSVGVSKVHGPGDLEAAVNLALEYDEWVLVEEAVVGHEVECGVLGSPGSAEASVVGEIVPSAEFYDYDDKYSGEGADLVIPADVPPAVADQARALALRAFDALRCDGLARVDFFYEPHGRGLLVNEVNTIPGFTPYSMYPLLWDASGVPYPALIDRLVELALARHERLAGRRGRPR